MADQGADVIKIEALSGDPTRSAGLAEGRPELPDENLTFDIENGNKRGMALNLKNPECYEILMQLLAQADIFITNWRPKALEKMKLDYESLKEKFPKLVYGSVTGYGDKGPDMDLPGFDFTAFWARSGILASLSEKGASPMNLIPSMGDRQVGMNLAAGVLAALYRAEKTGKGEKISVSLLGTAIFSQGTMIQTYQYGLIEYPLKKRESPSPLTCSYQTKDERFIQFCMPTYSFFIPFAKCLGKEEWLSDPRFSSYENVMNGNGPALFDAIAETLIQYTAAELNEIFTKADIPFAVAKVWREVLEDPQAWAADCFVNMEYPSGTRTLVRNPVHFEEAGLPEYIKGPRLGQHTKTIMQELGCSEDMIAKLNASGDILI
jgi:cinnamoyl-CoA:phenyllactate CoA-transferase